MALNVITDLKRLHRLVQVEVLIMIFHITCGIYWSTGRPFTYFKWCLHLWSGVISENGVEESAVANFCKNLDKNQTTSPDFTSMLSLRASPMNPNTNMTVSEAKNEMQDFAAVITMVDKIVGNAPTLLSAPIIGAISDRKGRKLVFLYILAILTSGYFICLMAAVKLFAMPYWWMLLNSFYVSFFSATSIGAIGLTRASLSDISDPTTGSRNVRLAVGRGGGIGMFAGNMITSFLLSETDENYLLPWVATMVGFGVTALYVVFGFQETLKPENRAPSPDSYLMMVLKSYKDGLRVLTKKREKGKRIKICIAVMSEAVFTIFTADLFGLQYLYLRSIFNWQNSQFIRFQSIKTLINTTAQLIIAPLLTKFTKIGDITVVLFSYACTLIIGFMVGFAKDDWTIYMTVLPGIIGTLGDPYLDAYISKQIGPDEFDAAFTTICRSVTTILPVCGLHNARHKSVTSTVKSVKSHLPLKTILKLWYIWAFYPTQTLEQIQSLMGPSPPAPKTTIHWYYTFRNICEQWCTDHAPIRKLGGPGKVVEIDESLFFRGKYGIGHWDREQQWVFGMVERYTSNVIVIPVDDRRAITLLALITEWVNDGLPPPGLPCYIMSDCWAAYGGINNLPNNYFHQSVNHKYRFVRGGVVPGETVHTQKIEATWGSIKRSMKHLRGMSNHDLFPTWLFQYMFRRAHDNKKIWQNTLHWAALQHPLPH